MRKADWAAVIAALDEAASPGSEIRFWLRDDDAVAVTPALERLGSLCEDAGMPVLLAVIPERAGQQLADWTERHRTVTPCQHGWSHTNHAKPGERACELGGDRDDATVLTELSQGQRKLRALFGPLADTQTLVPPWNRIRPSLLPRLNEVGFELLSTFRDPNRTDDPVPQRLDCDLDIIDWRNGRKGRSIEDCCERLVRLIGAARSIGEPIGILTHHLAHDEAAWQFLAEFFAQLGPRSTVRFISAAKAAGCGIPVRRGHHV